MTDKANKVGRPTSFGPLIIEKSYSYLECFESNEKMRELKYNQVIPTVEGLCSYIGIARSTVYLWIKEEGKEEFSDIVEGINEIQHLLLQNGGLIGSYNPTIAKLLLAKHGHSERTTSDHTSSDGSMSNGVDVKLTIGKDDITDIMAKL